MTALHLQLKRVYEVAEESDGCRILVDRLWPRGLSKEKAQVELWLKEIAPSNELRRWYGHDPQKWPEFRQRYQAELDACPELLAQLAERARSGMVTLLFSSKEERLNNAVVLFNRLTQGLIPGEE